MISVVRRVVTMLIVTGSSAAAMEEMPHSSISAIRNERTRLVMVFSSFDFFKNRISCF